MKKAPSDSGTLHLFSAVSVRRNTGRSAADEGAPSLCGRVHHTGPFTAAADVDDLDRLCELCEEAAKRENGED